jgi:HAD superfamily hydrolase (TIGR01549 family)
MSDSLEVLARACEEFFAKREPTRAEGLTVLERRIQALCEDLGLRPSATEIAHIAVTALAAWQSHIALDPLVPDFLGALRGYARLALISNFDHPRHVHSVLDAHALTRFFEVVVVSGEVGVKKPDPRIMHLALDRLGLRPAVVLPLTAACKGRAPVTDCPILESGLLQGASIGPMRHPAADGVHWNTKSGTHRRDPSARARGVAGDRLHSFRNGSRRIATTPTRLRMKTNKMLAAAVFTTFVLLTTVGCEEHKGPAERAGEKMDKGMEKAGEKLEDAGDKMKDAAHDATH